VSPSKLKEVIVETVLKGAYHDSYVQMAIDRTPINLSLEEYDVNTSKSSIIGFLGELEFNIVMTVITGGRGVVHGTGNIKRTSSFFNNRSITVDSVVDGIGFQIKNYSIKNGVVNFHQEDKQAGTLLQDRLELNEAIIELFGSYQYNQGIDKPSSEFLSLRSSMETFVENRTPEIIKANATKLIGLDNTNIGTDPLEGVGAQIGSGKNTFFYVNGKLLPGSAIVSGLITALRTNKDVQDLGVSVAATLSKPTEKPKYGENAVPSAKTAANQIKVNYSVKISFT
jgi:hypothetical protein